MKNKTIAGNKMGRKAAREIGCFSWHVDEPVTIAIQKAPTFGSLAFHIPSKQGGSFRPASQRRAVLELSLLR